MKLEQEFDLEGGVASSTVGIPRHASRGRDSNLHIYHYRMKLKLILMLYSVLGLAVEFETELANRAPVRSPLALGAAP